MTRALVSDELYTVEVLCPACGLKAAVPIGLATLLKRTRSKSELSVTLSQDAAKHACGQLSILDALGETKDGVLQW